MAKGNSFEPETVVWRDTSELINRLIEIGGLIYGDAETDAIAAELNRRIPVPEEE